MAPSLVDRTLANLSAPVFSPPPWALRCPRCRGRSTVPQGARVYLCMNPDCPDGPFPGLSPHALMLTIDALGGAHLLPWEEVVARDRIRKTDPRALLLGGGAAPSAREAAHA